MAFLNVQFELKNSEYRPFRKPDDTIQYVNGKYNQPDNVLMGILKNVQKRISILSCNDEYSMRLTGNLKKALEDAGHGTEESTIRYENAESTVMEGTSKNKGKRKHIKQKCDMV